MAIPDPIAVPRETESIYWLRSWLHTICHPWAYPIIPPDHKDQEWQRDGAPDENQGLLP